MNTARRIGALWGVIGTILFLLLAIERLAPHIVEMFHFGLSPLQIFILIAWVVFMLISEGYQGFQKQFSPRVVARSQYLRKHGTKLQLLAAPLFCMGYFNSSRKRLLVTYTITLLVVSFIILVRLLPTPWRGIVDTGVVLGLSYGIIWIVLFYIKSRKSKHYIVDPVIG